MIVNNVEEEETTTTTTSQQKTVTKHEIEIRVTDKNNDGGSEDAARSIVCVKECRIN